MGFELVGHDDDDDNIWFELHNDEAAERLEKTIPDAVLGRAVRDESESSVQYFKTITKMSVPAMTEFMHDDPKSWSMGWFAKAMGKRVASMAAEMRRVKEKEDKNETPLTQRKAHLMWVQAAAVSQVLVGVFDDLMGIENLRRAKKENLRKVADIAMTSGGLGLNSIKRWNWTMKMPAK